MTYAVIAEGMIRIEWVTDKVGDKFCIEQIDGTGEYTLEFDTEKKASDWLFLQLKWAVEDMGFTLKF